MDATRPKVTASTSESSWTPKLDSVLVRRAMVPSKPSMMTLAMI